MNWQREELRLKTCDLVAQDRAGSMRDDGYHRAQRNDFLSCAMDVTNGLEKVNSMMGALLE